MSIVSAVNAIPPIVVIALGACSVVFFLISMYLFDKQTKINKYAYLVTMMAKADNKGGMPKPLSVIVDRSGTMIPFISEPDERNKGLLVNDNYTLINPDLVKPSARLHLHRGPEMLFYPLPYYFPLNLHSSAALVQLAQDFRNNKYLNWIPNEIDTLNLLFNGTNTLHEDCRTIIDDAAKFGNEIPEFLLNDEVYDDEDEEFEEVEEEYEEIEEENEDEENEEKEIEEDDKEDLLINLENYEEVKNNESA